MMNKDFVFVLVCGVIGVLALFGVNQNITSARTLIHLNPDQIMIDRMSESLADSLKRNAELKNSILGATTEMNKTIDKNNRPTLKNFIEEIKLLLDTDPNEISLKDIAGARKKAEMVHRVIMTSTLDEAEKRIYVIEVSKIISSLDRIADISMIKKTIEEKKILNGVTLMESKIKSLELTVKDFEIKIVQNRWLFGIASFLSFFIVGFHFIYKKADNKESKKVLGVHLEEVKNISSEYVQEAFATLFTGTPYTLWIDEFVARESNPFIVGLNEVIFSYLKNIVSVQSPNTIILYNAYVTEEGLKVALTLENVSIQSQSFHYKILQDYIQSLNGKVQFSQNIQTKILFVIPV